MSEVPQGSSRGSSPGDLASLESTTESTSEDPATSPEAETNVLTLMKKRLPEYIVNCFLAAGYDVQEVISAMDISSNPGNSITQIESFIGRRYKGDRRFSITPAMDFEFPPGHRLRICNFVREVRTICDGDGKEHTRGRKRKRTCSGGVKGTKHRLTSTDESENEVNVSTVSNQIRRSISVWVRKQTDLGLKTLQENKHFSISVTRVAKDPHSLAVSVRCVGCNTQVRLQKRDNTSNTMPYLISNWCRHVKKCVHCKHLNVQHASIDKYLPSCHMQAENVGHNSPESDYPSLTTDSAIADDSSLPDFDSTHGSDTDRFLMSSNVFTFAPDDHPKSPCTSMSPVQQSMLSPSPQAASQHDTQVFPRAPPSV